MSLYCSIGSHGERPLQVRAILFARSYNLHAPKPKSVLKDRAETLNDN